MFTDFKTGISRMGHDRRFWAALAVAGLALGGGLLFKIAAQQPGAVNALPAAQTARIDLPLGNFAEHPLKRAIDLANASLTATAKLRDYSYVFVKREEVNGKPAERHEAVYMKIRREPFSVYVKTLGPAKVGCEAIYVTGKNNGLALAHGAGYQKVLLGTMKLEPRSDMMMEGQRYPITSAGFENMLTKIVQLYQQGLKFPESDVQISSGARVDGINCTFVQVTHTARRPEFPFHMTRVFYDEQTNLPVHWEAYGWPAREGAEPPVIEDYTYRNVQTNVGLTDRDFDAANEAYEY